MATETPAQSSLAALLRQRAFIFFWLARVCTASAFQMQGVVLGWQVYQLTGRALDLGLVGLCQFLPGWCSPLGRAMSPTASTAAASPC